MVEFVVMAVLFFGCVLTFSSLVCADLDKDGHICDHELHDLLKNAGHAMPGYMVRDIIKKLDRNHDNKISFDEFLSVCRSDLTLLNEQMCVCAFRQR